MGTIVRGTKTSAGGGTAFKTNTVIAHDEVNTDFDTAYNVINGNLDDDNISSLSASKISGGLDPSVTDDISATDADQDAILASGDYTSQTLATTLEEELQQLRHAIARISVGLLTERREAAATEVVNWIEQPASGPNHVINGDMDAYSGLVATPDAPDGWVLNGTPTPVVTAVNTAAEGLGRHFKWTCDAGGEGIKQTVTGLVANTKYLLSVTARVTAGDQLDIATTGADTNEWDNVNDALTSDTFKTQSYVLKTDATPTDIVILLTADSTDVIFVNSVSLTELADVPVRIPPGSVFTYPQAVITDTTEVTTSSFADVDELAVTVFIPGPGYEIDVHTELYGLAGSGGDTLSAQIFDNAVAASGIGRQVSFGGSEPVMVIKTFSDTSPSVGTHAITTRAKHTAGDSAFELGTDNLMESLLRVRVIKRW